MIGKSSVKEAMPKYPYPFIFGSFFDINKWDLLK